MCCALVACRKQPGFEELRAKTELELKQGYVNEALATAESGYQNSSRENGIWHWRFRLLRAEALVRHNDFEDGLSLLSIDPPSTYPPEITARRKSIQGLAFCLSKRYEDGEAALQQADRIGESDRRLQAEAHMAMGRCAWKQQQYDRAEAEFRRAERLADGADSFIQASAAGNIGILLMRAEHFDQAIDRFQEAVDLERSIHSLVLDEKNKANLADCYAELGDFKKAVPLAEQAHVIAAQIGNRRDEQIALINLGWAYLELGDLEKADASYLQALAVAEKSSDRERTALAAHDLAQLEKRRHNIDKAEEYWKKGTAALAAADSDPMSGNSATADADILMLRRVELVWDQAEIILARGQLHQAEQVLKRALQAYEMDPVMRSIFQNDLGIVYWRENRPQDADRLFGTALDSAELGFKNLKREEYRLSFLDRNAFYDNYIEFLAAGHRTVKALAIAERNRAQAIADRTPQEAKAGQIPFSIEAVQQKLHSSKQVALAYTVTNDQIFLWVITPGDYRLFTLTGGPDLFAQVGRYNQEIQERHSPEDSPEAKALYEKLILPAAKLIPKGSHVIIVPSRAVALVNFEALVVPGAEPRYWLEDAEVEYAGSLRGIVSGRQTFVAENRPEDLLVMGAPVEANKEFPALQHAPEEIKNVQSHFPASKEKVVTGAQAVPAAYRAREPANYRYIHFDTHGVNSDLSPLDSAIVLSAGPDKEYKLYAREIKDIPIHADLVTISACYGAGTRVYNAEGTIGLGWAFLRAGAHQVIAATWEIDDALTAKFMDYFYGELSHGKPAIDALHDSKLNMLHSTSFERHPYYWASLQLYSGY